ncbi:ABC transporter ATP-binding protein [Pseudoxanthomonas sangjuensis]|uniref:ABC transporter ATP-binding protein n=1 Tax=Pseudoxanthomonas sangjuensis TaxID=1503750 RepID=UPI001390D365|nr:ATP-binding cassette domain-containing protein [Pseudoxanthomonas sangjuensis]
MLDNLSFNVEEGDRLAILGRNGAGKSTLLRVLNGVYQPTQGRLEVQGSCQALLNMSLGFNGEATVHENIILRGVAMGLASGFLKSQVAQILEFAGLQRKAHHRLRTLSAGQKMRLGFAISTSVQHDIMLMDEWVGAGDAEFMEKAKVRMQNRVDGSKIVVLASHSVGLLRAICNKGILLEQGRLLYAGGITDALKAYHDLLAALRKDPEYRAPDPEIHLAGIVYGAVEEVYFDRGQLWLRGWSACTDGTIPPGLVVQAHGLRHAAIELQRYHRPDVVRHLGLNDAACGFRASFNIDTVAVLGGQVQDFQVYAGQSPESASVPLRIAGGVMEQLAGASVSVAPTRS